MVSRMMSRFFYNRYSRLGARDLGARDPEHADGSAETQESVRPSIVGERMVLDEELGSRTLRYNPVEQNAFPHCKMIARMGCIIALVSAGVVSGLHYLSRDSNEDDNLVFGTATTTVLPNYLPIERIDNGTGILPRIKTNFEQQGILEPSHNSNETTTTTKTKTKTGTGSSNGLDDLGLSVKKLTFDHSQNTDKFQALQRTKATFLDTPYTNANKSEFKAKFEAYVEACREFYDFRRTYGHAVEKLNIAVMFKEIGGYIDENPKTGSPIKRSPENKELIKKLREAIRLETSLTSEICRGVQLPCKLPSHDHLIDNLVKSIKQLRFDHSQNTDKFQALQETKATFLDISYTNANKSEFKANFKAYVEACREFYDFRRIYGHAVEKLNIAVMFKEIGGYIDENPKTGSPIKPSPENKELIKKLREAIRLETSLTSEICRGVQLPCKLPSQDHPIDNLVKSIKQLTFDHSQNTDKFQALQRTKKAFLDTPYTNANKSEFKADFKAYVEACREFYDFRRTYGLSVKLNIAAMFEEIGGYIDENPKTGSPIKPSPENKELIKKLRKAIRLETSQTSEICRGVHLPCKLLQDNGPSDQLVESIKQLKFDHSQNTDKFQALQRTKATFLDTPYTNENKSEFKANFKAYVEACQEFYDFRRTYGHAVEKLNIVAMFKEIGGYIDENKKTGSPIKRSPENKELIKKLLEAIRLETLRTSKICSYFYLPCELPQDNGSSDQLVESIKCLTF